MQLILSLSEEQASQVAALLQLPPWARPTVVAPTAADPGNLQTLAAVIEQPLKQQNRTGHGRGRGKPAPLASQRWSSVEDQQLHNKLAQGYRWKRISHDLGRTVAACQTRASEKGYSRRRTV